MFASAGVALSPSVRAAATREVADALDNMSITSVTDRAAASLSDGGSVGAMKIDTATLDDLTPVSGGVVGKAAWKAGSYLTSLTRLMESPSRTVRKTTLELAENNFTLKGNERGIETPVAVETRTRGWQREEAADLRGQAGQGAGRALLQEAVQLFRGLWLRPHRLAEGGGGERQDPLLPL